MSDWSKPTLTSNYSDFVAEVKGRDDDLAKQFDGTTSPNVPTGTIKWNSSNRRHEKWNGSAWSELVAKATTAYAIRVEIANDADRLGGQLPSYYTDIPARLGYTPLSTAGGTVSGDLFVAGGNSRLPAHFFHYEYDSAGNVYEHFYTPGNENVKNSAANLRVSSTSGYYKALYFAGDGSFQWDGRNVLHAGNFTNYALDVAGGTLFGSLRIGNQTTFDNPGGWNKQALIDAQNHGRYRIKASAYNGNGPYEAYFWVDTSTSQGSGLWFNSPSFDFNGAGALTKNGASILHANNYSNYALPLSGGTLTGNTYLVGGHQTTRFQLAHKYDGANQHVHSGYLTMWVSEPGISYPMSGIGANVNVNGQWYGRQNSFNPYAVYMRFNTDSGETEFWNTTGTPGVTGGQGARVMAIGVAGSIWTSNYGWLQDYFFNSVGNCIREGFGAGNTGNCSPGESSVVNCYGSGNMMGYQRELVDNGGQIAIRSVRYYYNCNCNCACDCY